jgi:hypothetical protein
MAPPFRIEPNLPAGAYQTFAIRSPKDVTVKAACEQARCQAWLHGWETTIDERTPLGAEQGRYIRHGSGRTFTEHRTAAGLTVFRFASRQRCFAEHRTRPERYLERGGDWRGQTGPRTDHSPAGWLDSFGTNQLRLAELIQRG